MTAQDGGVIRANKLPHRQRCSWDSFLGLNAATTPFCILQSSLTEVCTFTGGGTDRVESTVRVRCLKSGCDERDETRDGQHKSSDEQDSSLGRSAR